MTTVEANPVQLYMASLSDGSQGMVRCLDVIAKILGHDGDADSFPWETVTYRDSMKVRVALTDRYKPSTVNKMLSTLRGVLKQTWRLGLIDADHYRRAVDVPNLRSSNLLSGRALAERRDREALPGVAPPTRLRRVPETRPCSRCSTAVGYGAESSPGWMPRTSSLRSAPSWSMASAGSSAPST